MITLIYVKQVKKITNLNVIEHKTFFAMFMFSLLQSLFVFIKMSILHNLHRVTKCIDHVS